MENQSQLIEAPMKTLMKALKTESLIHVLKTYKLTEEFCANYILFNDRYVKSEEDSYLCVSDVIQYQPHLDEATLCRELDYALETREC